MDEHVNEWDKQTPPRREYTNRWYQDVIRKMADEEEWRASNGVGAIVKPIDRTKGEWQLTPYTERGRQAIHAEKLTQEHNAKAEASKPLENLIFYGIIFSVLALAVWGIERKREAASSAGAQPQTQIMHCASLPNYRDQAECLDRARIELDAPKDEVRRR